MTSNIERGWLARAPEPGDVPRAAFTPLEAALSAGTNRSRIFNEIKAGRLKAYKAGKATLILPNDLLKWLHSLPACKPGRAPAEAHP
jgi:hypothetical protein